jgi:hypothetical protein
MAPIDTLPELARALRIRSGAPDPGALRLVRLRHKPGRGMTALLVPAAGPAMWLRHDGDDVSVEIDGADAGLPALAAASLPVPASPVWVGLEGAARALLGDPAARLTGVNPTTIRHKPGSRCVLRYELTVTRGGSGGEVRLGVYGKLFAEPANAVAADGLLSALHDEQSAAGAVVVPRPLGAVESLGLALTAAVGDGTTPPRAGTEVLGPARAGVPTEALAAAAAALAALHRSAIRLPAGRHTGASGPSVVTRRAALLAGYAPASASRVHAAAAELSRMLATTAAPAVPTHGGFKPSQLVYTGARCVTVADFDGFGLADPALDVGYFLAYLRPARLWRGSAASRAWFDAAATTFTTAYARSLTAAGAGSAEVAATLRRAPLQEAAALLKIAGRRPHRCNAQRPAELAAILGEIEECTAAGRAATAAA